MGNESKYWIFNGWVYVTILHIERYYQQAKKKDKQSNNQNL